MVELFNVTVKCINQINDLVELYNVESIVLDYRFTGLLPLSLVINRYYDRRGDEFFVPNAWVIVGDAIKARERQLRQNNTASPGLLSRLSHRVGIFSTRSPESDSAVPTCPPNESDSAVAVAAPTSALSRY